jgi:hypothetical protein
MHRRKNSVLPYGVRGLRAYGYAEGSRLTRRPFADAINYAVDGESSVPDSGSDSLETLAV